MQIANHLRPLVVAVVSLMTVAAALTGTTLVGHSFRFSERPLTIPTPQGRLDAVVTLPTHGAPRGVVVMVHGDGAVDATQDGLYDPWFEGAADAGFATLSWSKPGVGRSEGNWLSQSMSDRASEVVAALDWAMQSDEIPTDSIVLWGASQAGWVLPKVVSARVDIDGVVAVGPAINWLRQGRFNLLAELAHDNTSAQDRAQALSESDRARRLLERGAPYAEYLASTTSADPMSEGRWGFVMRNFTADAEDDLVASATRKIPVHLMVGIHDRNVDIAETEATYRSIFGSSLTVTHVDGSHSLARTVMEESETVGLATAIVWPRAILAPHTIDDYASFLSGLR